MSPRPLLQSTLFARTMGRIGREVLTLPGGGIALRRPVLGLPVTLLSRGGAAGAGHLPAGLQIVNAEGPEDGAALARQGFVRIRPPLQVAELDLRPPVPALRAGLQQKWRNRLRVAEGAGLGVEARAFDPRRDRALLSQEAARQRARRYRGLDPRLVEAMARIDGGAVRVISARLGRRRVAAGLFLLSDRVLTYQIGWSSDAGRRTQAQSLVLWAAMTGSAGAAERLDLGPVGMAPGPDRFKLGTGATLRPLGGTWIRLQVAWPRRRSLPT